MLNRAPKKASRRHINSILVGFRLVECLETTRRPLSLKELAERCGLAPGHAHQYLTSFSMIGLVGQDPDSGHYELGPYALTLGLAALRSVDVLESAKRPMRALERATGQTVLLAVWANHGPTIVSSISGTHSIPLRVMVGFVMSLESATGRVFRAYLPKWQTNPIRQSEAAREGTVVDAKAQARGLAEERRIVRIGISASGKTRVDGYASQAVPVFDHSAALCAVMTITGRHEDFSKQGAEMERHLRAAGHALSARMGYTIG